MVNEGGDGMKQICVTVTDELHRAVDTARGTRDRNSSIEDWLWRIRAVQDAARQLGVSRPTRKPRGRPRKEAT
jgi:hypothetical protein